MKEPPTLPRSRKGVFSFAPFEQFSEQEFHRQFNTNVLGMFLMIEAALPAFGAEVQNMLQMHCEMKCTSAELQLQLLTAGRKGSA